MLAFDVRPVADVSWLDAALTIAILLLTVRSFYNQHYVRQLAEEVERQRRFDMRIDGSIKDIRNLILEKTDMVKRIEEAKNKEEAEVIIEDLLDTLKALEES